MVRAGGIKSGPSWVGPWAAVGTPAFGGMVGWGGVSKGQEGSGGWGKAVGKRSI